MRILKTKFNQIEIEHFNLSSRNFSSSGDADFDQDYKTEQVKISYNFTNYLESEESEDF